MRNHSNKAVTIIFLLSLGVWIYLFRKFLSNDLLLIADARNYYEHTRFLIDNLARGVFPLWDPSTNGGVPAEFFLRRVGAYNPFYLLLLIPIKLNAPFLTTYLFGISLYYFLGMIGFYKCAVKIFKNQIVAISAFLLLYFSTFSTLLFGSFIILSFVPWIWFFFFLLKFKQEVSRFSMLGMVFCLMIILQTYIPFYFLTLFIATVIFCLFTFFKQVKEIIFNILKFAKKEKMFFSLCVGLVVLSLYPGVQFYMEMKGDEIVLPSRNYNAPVEHTLSVPMQRADFGGVIPHLTVNELLFENLKRMRMDRLFVPQLFFIFLLFSMILKINRRMIFFFMLGFFFFLLAIYDGAVYKFLYERVFYFKFFRNFQFFFWLITLPAFIYLLCEHFNQFLKCLRDDSRLLFNKIAVLVIHILALCLILSQEGGNISSYLALFMSFIIFHLLVRGFFINKQSLLLFCIFVTVIVQPFQAYYYLSNNWQKNESPTIDPYLHHGESPYLDFKMPSKKTLDSVMNQKNAGPLLENKIPIMYMGVSGFQTLHQNLPASVIGNYFENIKFIGFQNIEYKESAKIDLNHLSRNLSDLSNIVYLEPENDGATSAFIGNRKDARAQLFSSSSESLKVKNYNVNSIKLDANFSESLFLVFTDAYHSNWKAYINGAKIPVYRANIAFKGVFVPAGKIEVEFRYKTNEQYLIHIFYLLMYFAVFLYLMKMSILSKGKGVAS